MSEGIHTVPTWTEQWEERHRAEQAKRRAEEAKKHEEFLFRGIKSRSAARVSRSWDSDDNLHRIETTDEGLRFRVSDPDWLDRGRDHEIVVSHGLMERIFLRRSGALIAARDAKIAELEKLLAERDARLAGIARLATMNSEVAELDADDE